MSSNQTSFTITNSTGNVSDANSNRTSPAYVALCYIADSDGKNYQNFLDQCKNNKTLTDTFNTTDAQNRTLNVTWILVSNADTEQDQNLDVLKSLQNYTESQVLGLIMISKYLPRQLDDTMQNETSKFWFP